MPYLFENKVLGELSSLPPAQTILSFKGQALDHFEYFRLCLSAHFLTVATPVPTDVDNQIRQKLWPKNLALETALKMADLVLEFHDWDSQLVSARSVNGLTGHMGEWFTVACGAYCALKQYSSKEALTKREEIFSAIENEIIHHSDIFGSLWKAGDGLGCLIGSASIAHNFGDLDRVMDMWKLDVGDPLRLQFYKMAANPYDSEGELRMNGRLWTAGELYKESIDGSSMALENHRHYALRAPRMLRESPQYLVPNGPFFDSWGEKVAQGLKPRESDLAEIVKTLLDGWERQPKSVGYGRGLHGIFEVVPELKLSKLSAAQATLGVSRNTFEKRWNKLALEALDDIPGRA
ncbi:MAG: hypothetical protein KA715_09590 [Xanthomonadaceae bacterium]|nr:hypothetical protein [Xanthomonadaceae bacterium]